METAIEAYEKAMTPAYFAGEVFNYLTPELTKADLTEKHGLNIKA
jgi:hypothetical protein